MVAVLEDLMFTVRIADAARRAGIQVDFAKKQDDLAPRLAGARAAILDLNYVPPETISALKSAPETRAIPLIGYVSHVESEVIRQARESGCDSILARSAFVQKLAEMMQEFAASG
ncbi:MAG TPA: response regulator [Bryobacteraceae bacterium]